MRVFAKIDPFLFATKRAQEALAAAQEAVLRRGKFYYEELHDLDRNVDETLVLGPEDWHSLRVFMLSREDEYGVLDVVYSIDQGVETYHVKPGWDIGSIDPVNPE